MIKLETITATFQKLPPSKLAMLFGAVAVGAGVVVENDFRDFLFTGGFIVFLFGLLMAVGRSRAMAEIRKHDLEIRKFKIDKGLPPEDDKTVFKIQE